MTRRVAAFVAIALLSAIGVITLIIGARGVYADWTFVRHARRQHEARRPVTSPAGPSSAAPVSVPPPATPER